MKRPKPDSVLATFVSAVLSLLLPASAMSLEETLRPPREPAPVDRGDTDAARERTAVDDALRGDPILRYKWGPGDADLPALTFHIALPDRFRGKSPPPPGKPGRDTGAS